MKRILLTGGAGFIGSHTSLLLLDKGYEVLILDSLVNSSISVIEKIKKLICKENPSFKNNLKFIKGDIRDVNLLRSIFSQAEKEENKFSAVIHFAGLKAVGESCDYPIDYWENNISGTINLIKIMSDANCKTILFSSSATIYGAAGNQPINEQTSIKPTNPYGNTKAFIETFLEDIYKSNSDEWKIANLRYFNPVGAHSSGLIGENPKGEANNIFPLIMKVANYDSERFEIFGNDWDTPDGTGIRDYIHVMDVAEGHIKTFEYLERKNNLFLNLNLGTGKGTSVLELIKTYEESNNVKIPYVFAPKRSGDISSAIADNSLAKSLLNWEPKRDLKQMCIDSWNWKKMNS